MVGPVLVVGGDGKIGRALAGHLEALGVEVLASTRRPECVAVKRPLLDLSQPEAGLDTLPGVASVVLTAAVPGLRACEDDPAGSARINVAGTNRLAEAMAGRGAQVLLLSTDKVFDGSVALRQREDSVSPRTEYGRQKALAEAGVRGLGQQGAILRLSKVLAPEEPLLREWRAALAAGRVIGPFTNMYLAPVPTALVCRLIALLIGARSHGIFHLSGAEDRPYADFAGRLATKLGATPGLIQPCACDPGQHSIDARPRHSSLDMSLELERFGLRQPSFAEVVDGLI